MVTGIPIVLEVKPRRGYILITPVFRLGYKEERIRFVMIFAAGLQKS